jgi:iron complex transport system substrate-binding protein
MVRRIIITVVIVLFSGLLAFAAWMLGRNASYNFTGRTITDLAGRQVAVPERVDRIIALGPGALRLVAYLGSVDRIVGIEDMEKRMATDLYTRPYARLLGEAFYALPVVGPGGPGALPDSERIMMCNPDVIVATNIDPAQLDNLQARTQTPVVCLSYGELGVWRAEARQSLSLLGDILGVSERAGELNTYLESLEDDLRRRTEDIPESDRPHAYFGGISYKGAHGLDSTEAGYLPAEMVRAYNLANEVGRRGHFFVDREQILIWNPDVIFVDSGSRDILDEGFATDREFYQLLGAAQTGQMFSLLPYNYYNTNIELAVLNAYFIGKTLYPQRFQDVRVEDMANEIMMTFLGIDARGQAIPAYRTITFSETGVIDWGHGE